MHRYYLDLDDLGLAKELGLNLNTVKSHLHRGRHHLRAVLEELRPDIREQL